MALKRQGFVPMTREECLPLFPDDYGIRDLMAPHLQGRKFPASYVNVRQHLEKKLSENEADSLLKHVPKDTLFFRGWQGQRVSGALGTMAANALPRRKWLEKLLVRGLWISLKSLVHKARTRD